MRRYSSFIAGLAFMSRTGAHCHHEVDEAGLATGDVVHLSRDENNPHDPNAVAVFSPCCDYHLGFIPARHATWVAERLDNGREISATVGEVRRQGGRADGDVVNVELFLDVPFLAEPRRRLAA